VGNLTVKTVTPFLPKTATAFRQVLLAIKRKDKLRYGYRILAIRNLFCSLALGSLSADAFALNLARQGKRVRLDISVGHRLLMTQGAQAHIQAT